MRVAVPGAVIALIVAGIFLLRPAPVESLDDRACDLFTGWVSRGARLRTRGDRRNRRKEPDPVRPLALAERSPGLLARRILDQGAAAVVLDMMFPAADRGARTGSTAPAARAAEPVAEARSGANDQALADALSGRPTVAGYTLTFGSNTGGAPAMCVQPLPLVVVGPGRVRDGSVLPRLRRRVQRTSDLAGRGRQRFSECGSRQRWQAETNPAGDRIPWPVLSQPGSRRAGGVAASLHDATHGGRAWRLAATPG